MLTHQTVMVKSVKEHEKRQIFKFKFFKKFLHSLSVWLITVSLPSFLSNLGNVLSQFRYK